MKKRKQKRAWLFAGLRVLLALGIAFFICQLELHYFESLLYDLRVRTKPTPKISDQIVLIKIDNKTQELLKRTPEALDHESLFEILGQAKPHIVVATHNIGMVIGSYDELERMAEATKAIPFLGLEDSKLPQSGVEDEFQLLPPLQDIKIESAPVTSDTHSFAKDGVTRRFIYDFEGLPLAHFRLASEINGRPDISDYRGLFQLKRTKQGYIDYRPTGSYLSYSFADVLEGLVPEETFAGKIVLIGMDTRAQTSDYVATPFSRDILAMSKVELHANILDTMILDSAPVKAPNKLSFLITCLIAIMTVFVVLTLRPARGLLILMISMGLFAIFAWALFVSTGLWLDIAHPFLAIFICYYFFIPYRLIMENRRSWEYYQRNTLLTQVEELKSNFLRMMSHDLKTPLARIQGMTDVALRDKNSLSGQQTDALQTINRSSEELSKFVGSILDLGRIESKEIKLQLKSKDINALLNQVIENLQFLAKKKNIKIHTEFEPMFSMKIDEDLIRQVFTNLIENAIKYSPEDSSILVSAEEIEGRVIVQVADQGMGIPEEDQTQLFTKFYRSRDVREGSIKGTGLGLYLARYFVNLHRGEITLESEKSKGSTFTVELPMEI